MKLPDPLHHRGEESRGVVHCYTQLRNFPKGKRTKAGDVDRTAHKQPVPVIRYCLPCCSESLKIPSLFPPPPSL